MCIRDSRRKGALVDLEKGDFVGRDALVNADRQTLLLGLTCSGTTPSFGSQIIDNGTVVGHITAGVPSPTLGLGVGYARFAAPGDWVGREMELRLPDGSTHVSNIVDLPFFDKERKIVRGIDRTIP